MAGQTKKLFLFIPVILMIILGFAVYSNSLNGQFVWDDWGLVKYNTYIRSWQNIPKILTEDMGAGASLQYSFYRPLQIFTYAIDYSIWGLNVLGYHLTNTLLHILVALAIYWLVTMLYQNKLLSLLASIFFIIYPVHTETVSYISNRADLLCALFMITCFIFYIKHLHSESAVSYILVILSYILAILSKENALILPALLLLYHYTFKKKIRLKILLPILSIIFIYILLRATVLKFLLADTLYSNIMFRRIPGFFVAITNYLSILLLPVNLHLEYENRFFSFAEPKAWLGLAISLLLLIYAFKKRNSDRLTFFSVFWFFIALLPVSGIYPVNSFCMTEHWLYFPSLGFFLILSDKLSSIYKTKKFWLFLVGLLVFYSYLAVIQNNYWKNPVALLKKSLKYSPHSSRIYNSLGIAYSEIGDTEKAIASYKKAIELNPRNPEAHNNLGTIYEKMGKAQEAILFYKKAIAVNPNDEKAYHNLAAIYIAIGKDKEAIPLYRKSIKINPRYTEAYINLGRIYCIIGKDKEAIALCKKAIELKPNLAVAHNNLALAYYYEKQYDLAIKHCDKAIELGYKVNPQLLEFLKPHRQQK